MKNRLSKTIVLVLSLVLLIGSAAAVSVSAEENENYNILGMNVVHGDQTYVLLAVDVAPENVGNVTVSYTVGAGEEKIATYWPEITADETLNPYAGCAIFFTEGISPKDVGEIITAKAYKAGTDGEGAVAKNVSVDMYLYRMLYRNDYVNATGAKLAYKGLYESHIAYASYAQEALWNQKHPDEQRVLVNEKIYVYAVSATINGARDVLLTEAGNVTLTPDEGLAANTAWVVKTYNADGTVTTTQASSNTIAITGPSIIEAINPNMITFDDLSVGPISGNVYIKHNGTNRMILTENNKEDARIEIIELNGSKALKSVGKSAGINVSNTIKVDGANATVFEADMTVFTDGGNTPSGYKPLMLDWRSVGGTEKRHLYFGNVRGKGYNADISGNYPERNDFLLMRDCGGQIDDASNSFGVQYGESAIPGWPTPETVDEELDINAPYICIGETFKLRMEYYWAVEEGGETVGKIKIYLNDAYITTINAAEVASKGGMNEIRIYSSQMFYIDNIVYEQAILTY